MDGVIRTLLARGLIEEAGHDQESGAVVFATTRATSWNGWARTSLDDLPPLGPDLPEVDELEAELGQPRGLGRGAGALRGASAEPAYDEVRSRVPT